MNSRKQIEASFHDKLRDQRLESNKNEWEQLTANKKFYAITRKSTSFVSNILKRNCKNKKALDYCCGNGSNTIFLAKQGAQAVGIDISPISIANCKKKAIEAGVEKNTNFLVMDAENLEFAENYFYMIFCSGVLHHLDIKKAFSELSRVLKPEGKIICQEPLIYNPVFQYYRKKTPHLRTKWETEHILSKKDIELAKQYFDKVEIKFFHLAALAAVPFRNLPGFHFILTLLEKIDAVLLRLPLIKWLSWQMVFILSQPQKTANLTLFEDRKQQEITHYDFLAKQWQAINDADKWQTDAHQLKHEDYSSYAFLDDLLKKYCHDKKVLDYGCGTGIHSLAPLKYGASEVIGIDLSEESLKIARERAEKEGLADKTQFIKMDCEHLEFPDNSFDVILDSGTFSSLDLDKVLSEIARVLKSDGKLIGIETLGHNPLTNLKRKLNFIRGNRTKWALNHIFKVNDLKLVKKYFDSIQMKYFHLTVLFAMPFRKIPGMIVVIKLLDKFDSLLLKIPFLQKYGFKIVFVFSEPKKSLTSTRQ